MDINVIMLSLLGMLHFQLKKPPLFIKWALAFLSVACISLLFSPLNLNFLQLANSFSYILRFFIYLFLGWLIFSGIFKNFNEKVPEIFTISGITLASLGIIQLIFYPDLMFLTQFGWDPHFFRTVSTFLDPNFLGGFLVITLLLITIKITESKRMDKISLYYLVLFLIVYFSLITTFSRGAGLMLFITFTSYSILRKSAKFLIISLLLTAFFAVGYFWYIQNIALPRGVDKNQSAISRIGSWSEGLQIWQRSPILGVGFNSYRYALDQYDLVTDNVLGQKGATSNDSSLLFVLSTTGIIGLTVYLMFLFSIFKVGWERRNNISGTVLLSVIIGLFFHSFFTNSLFYPFFLITIILLTIHTLSSTR